MLTGGQVSSLWLSDATGGAASAGSSGFPPKKLLKRSPSDCDDAGEASIPQLIPNETAANNAMLRYRPGRAAVMTARLSPIQRPRHLARSDHVAPRPLIA